MRKPKALHPLAATALARSKRSTGDKERRKRVVGAICVIVGSVEEATSGATKIRHTRRKCTHVPDAISSAAAETHYTDI
jgi:hypothetical protein